MSDQAIVTRPFDRTIVQYKCTDESIYKNEKIKESLDFLFNLEKIKNSYNPEQHGKALSSCGHEDLPIIGIPGGENLVFWVRDRLIDSAKYFGFKNIVNVRFGRTWANKMFKGCEGRTHGHRYNNQDKKSIVPDCVGIFYFEVPENGSNLVFCRPNGNFITQAEKLIEEFDPRDLYIQETKTGDLVIHDADFIHGVTKHHSDTPRICFIFEFTYIYGYPFEK